MGLQIGDIVPRKSVEFKDLKGKTIAIDAYNTIYQFLSTIRQPDGTPLMDSEGKITSHLSGLFYRNINLMQEGLKLVYVFDGKPPEQKFRTHEKRQENKDKAREHYKQALDREDIEGMGKYAKQLVKITPAIIEESKELLESLGIAVIQAPSEGESQAAYLAKKSKCFAVGSQDYDSLLFQAPRLIQNLTLARKRKTLSGFIYISPEIIELDKVLNNLQINIDQLICIGILCGTDYNPGGVKGIGQKKALDIVKKLREPYLIFKSLEEQIKNQASENRDFDWQEIYELFHKPDINKTQEIKFPKFQPDKTKKILLKREFSENRIDSALQRLEKSKEESKQQTLF